MQELETTGSREHKEERDREEEAEEDQAVKDSCRILLGQL